MTYMKLFFFFFLFCGNWLIALICLSCPCSRQTSVSPEFKQRLQCKDLLSLRWCWKFVSWWSLCMGNAIDTNTGKFLATANYKCILATVSPSSYFLFFPLFFLCFLQTAPATAVCVTGEYNTTVTTVGDPSMIFKGGFPACLFPCHVPIVSYLVLEFYTPWEGTISLFCVCTASEAVMPWFFTNPGKCSSSTNGKYIWDTNKLTFFSPIKQTFFSVTIWNGVAFHYSPLQLSWELPVSFPTSVTSLLYQSWSKKDLAGSLQTPKNNRLHYFNLALT